MPRTIDQVIKSIINGDSNIPYTVLIRAEFEEGTIIAPWNDNVFRVNLAGQSVYWDEFGVGEKEYIGSGDLIDISSVEEGVELQNYVLNLSISGLPTDPSLIQEIKNSKYKNGSLIMYLAILDKEYSIQFDTNEEEGPIVLFAGRMDTMNITVGETSTVDVQTSSRLSDWERTRGGRYNRQTQGRYYDLNLLPINHPHYKSGRDQGFDYVESLQQLELQWGGKVGIGHGREGYTVPNGGRGGGGGHDNFRFSDPAPINIPANIPTGHTEGY